MPDALPSFSIPADSPFAKTVNGQSAPTAPTEPTLTGFSFSLAAPSSNSGQTYNLKAPVVAREAPAAAASDATPKVPAPASRKAVKKRHAHGGGAEDDEGYGEEGEEVGSPSPLASPVQTSTSAATGLQSARSAAVSSFDASKFDLSGLSFELPKPALPKSAESEPKEEKDEKGKEEKGTEEKAEEEKAKEEKVDVS